MANELGLTTVAEGVENREQHTRLRAAGSVRPHAPCPAPVAQRSACSSQAARLPVASPRSAGSEQVLFVPDYPPPARPDRLLVGVEGMGSAALSAAAAHGSRKAPRT